jgi:hypothetical protein
MLTKDLFLSYLMFSALPVEATGSVVVEITHRTILHSFLHFLAHTLSLVVVPTMLLLTHLKIKTPKKFSV